MSGTTLVQHFALRQLGSSGNIAMTKPGQNVPKQRHNLIAVTKQRSCLNNIVPDLNQVIERQIGCGAQTWLKEEIFLSPHQIAHELFEFMIQSRVRERETSFAALFPIDQKVRHRR